MVEVDSIDLMQQVVEPDVWELRNSALSSLKLLAEDRLRVDLVGYGEKPPVEFALIDQLRGAAFVRGVESATSGSSRGAGIPLDIVASEMFSTLMHELHDDAVVSGAVSVYASPDPKTDALALIEKLPVIDDAQWLSIRSGIWLRWCERIREYLSPTRRTPIPGFCPNAECRADKHVSYDDEGEEIRDHALRALWIDEEVEGVECSCCFSFWPRRSLWQLANSLDPALVLKLRAGSV